MLFCNGARGFAPAHTGAELAYYDTGVRTSVRRLAVWAVTFLEFRRASPSSFSFFKLDGKWADANRA